MLSLSTVAVLPSTQVKVESSRMEHVLINRKHNKVNKKKQNFINPITVVTNTEAENI